MAVFMACSKRTASFLAVPVLMALLIVAACGSGDTLGLEAIPEAIWYPLKTCTDALCVAMCNAKGYQYAAGCSTFAGDDCCCVKKK